MQETAREVQGPKLEPLCDLEVDARGGKERRERAVRVGLRLGTALYNAAPTRP